MDDWDYDWDNLKQVKQKHVNPVLRHRQFFDKTNYGMYLKLISINFQNQIKQCKFTKKGDPHGLRIPTVLHLQLPHVHVLYFIT